MTNEKNTLFSLSLLSALPVAPIFVDASSVCSANGWVEGALVVIGASVSGNATGTSQ